MAWHLEVNISNHGGSNLPSVWHESHPCAGGSKLLVVSVPPHLGKVKFQTVNQSKVEIDWVVCPELIRYFKICMSLCGHFLTLNNYKVTFRISRVK